MTNKLRHPQSILAIDTVFIRNLADSIGLAGAQVLPIKIEELAEQAVPHLFVGCRDTLEKDERFRQILPYLLFIRPTAEGKIEFFAYQRGKGIGENRLLGKVSVGVGGHVDLIDLVYSPQSVINLNATVGASFTREAAEEIIFSEEIGDPKVVSAGCIVDDSDAVGRVHLGILLACVIPVGVELTCAEEELTTIGFRSAEDLLANYELENWSRIALTYAQETMNG